MERWKVPERRGWHPGSRAGGEEEQVGLPGGGGGGGGAVEPRGSQAKAHSEWKPVCWGHSGQAGKTQCILAAMGLG